MTSDDAGRLRADAIELKADAEAWIECQPPDDHDPDHMTHWRRQVRVARALLGLLPAADAGERRFGPRYVVWVSSRQFCMCGTLAEALDWRAKIGGTVYEPLGMSAAEKVAAEPAIDGPAAGGGA